MRVLIADERFQISVESAFLESLAEGTPLTQIEFHGIHDAPAPISNILFLSSEDVETKRVEYRYVPVERNIFGNWKVGYSGKCSKDRAPQDVDTEFVSFHTHHLWLPYDYNSMSNISVVCGHITKQSIQTVAVIWQDGTMTQDVVEEDRFVLFASGRVPACQLQLFDQKNTLVKEIDLSQIDFVSTDATIPLPHCTNQPTT